MASSLPLVNALLRALRISATSSHIEAAAGAARLVGNLSPDPRFVGLLQESHSLEPLLRVRTGHTPVPPHVDVIWSMHCSVAVLMASRSPWSSQPAVH